jgi:uncharacterized membrane protein YdcZ (DUF606 family)
MTVDVGGMVITATQIAPPRIGAPMIGVLVIGALMIGALMMGATGAGVGPKEVIGEAVQVVDKRQPPSR